LQKWREKRTSKNISGATWLQARDKRRNVAECAGSYVATPEIGFCWCAALAEPFAFHQDKQ
jgi:hypothetical protein